MRFRRPRFAFLLIAVLALLGGLLALAHSNPQRLGPPSAIGSKPARACETARATAERTAHARLRATVKAQLPVSVTERAVVRGRLAVETRSETIVERVGVNQPLTVQRTAVIARRACAVGETPQAAEGRALTIAYRTALRQAQSAAAAQAQRDANALVAQMGPGELAQAHQLAVARARNAAKELQMRLATAALAAARARPQVPPGARAAPPARPAPPARAAPPAQASPAPHATQTEPSH